MLSNDLLLKIAVKYIVRAKNHHFDVNWIGAVGVAYHHVTGNTGIWGLI